MARYSAERNAGRVKGRAGSELRRRRLTLHPLCADCKARGIVRATEEIDHIIPLAYGGTDTDDNVQGLCRACHAYKSAIEDASHGGSQSHPLWLRPSAIPLTIVCGPPAAGKTTWVHDRARPGDVVIDLDAIAASLTGTQGHRQRGADLTPALRARNAMLGSLSRATGGCAWFIVMAPTQAERQWWQHQIGGEVVVIDPGIEMCLRRVRERGATWQEKVVRDWYRPKPWLAPHQRPTPRSIGADGWPVE